MSRSFVPVFIDGAAPDPAGVMCDTGEMVGDKFWRCPVHIRTDASGVHLVPGGGDTILYGPVDTRAPMSDQCKNTPVYAAAFGLVTNPDGKFLVVQKKTGTTWFPPGGMLEGNELPEAACRREVKEETGVVVDNLKLVFAYESKMARNGVVGRHNLMLFFQGSSTQTDLAITDTSEIAAAKWVSHDEFAAMDTTPGIRFCLAQWGK